MQVYVYSPDMSRLEAIFFSILSPLKVNPCNFHQILPIGQHADVLYLSSLAYYYDEFS